MCLNVSLVEGKLAYFHQYYERSPDVHTKDSVKRTQYKSQLGEHPCDFQN